ncbi:Nuclear transcription factor Y subunit B-5 [Bienertia sinuspersici]
MVDHESDRLLPIANIGRIMKQILPPSAKISKGAKGDNARVCHRVHRVCYRRGLRQVSQENRKTVNGDDICWALSTLGFDTMERQ